MNKGKQHTVPAFTIFEVTVVLAIMSVVVSMVAFSTQSLFKQMKVTEDIHAELNNFYKVRSMLWYDCVMADSITFQENEFLAFTNGVPVQYRVEEDRLYRNQDGQDRDLNLDILSLEKMDVDAGSDIILTFDWKGEPLEWRFFNLPNLADGVNQYFDTRDG
ncbi:MAG: hypothetical protein NXI10_05635 [bacterium]|nr:hypothetical protein [bacterium]